MFRAVITVFLCLAYSSAYSRPVSYPGGWTLMLKNDGDRYSMHTHYSPSVSYSLGYRTEYWREDDYQIHTLQLNNLLKRWNKRHSQANVYLKSGLGLAYSDQGAFNSKTAFAAYTGLAADWETRRLFAAYENRITDAGDITDNFRQLTRFGFAPYVAEYGQLHTWLMLEFRHAPEAGDEFTITPLVRLFKGPSLLEAGINENSDVLFNFIHRF